MEKVENYLKLNDKYLKEGDALLEKGDCVQASEKFWGAAAEVIKAIAAKREIDIRSHGEIHRFITTLSKELNDKIASGAVISLDVGENGWWFGRNFWMKRTQKMVMSGYLASMGAGLQGAMAAQLAFPQKQAVCITGDGGFTMVMGDFLTAVKHGLAVKVFLFNNKQLGMIMQEQRVENYPNWQTDLYNCNFAQYARNCGGYRN
jgi:thiamine pyrophosphate-dependent acetolactate synthase large subunit-like protein